jgi:triosephosphate isomerase
MAGKLIIGNWKMNTRAQSAQSPWLRPVGANPVARQSAGSVSLACRLSGGAGAQLAGQACNCRRRMSAALQQGAFHR